MLRLFFTIRVVILKFDCKYYTCRLLHIYGDFCELFEYYLQLKRINNVDLALEKKSRKTDSVSCVVVSWNRR